MKILAINGSPRAEKGNTHTILLELLKGIKESGGAYEICFLSKCNIKDCLGCRNCWKTGSCVHDDEMKELTNKYTAADIVIFATPLYVDNISGLMKRFIERLVCRPLELKKDSKKETIRVKKGNSPEFVAVSSCSYPEQSHFQVLELYFRRFARNENTKLIAEIYRGGAELLNDKTRDAVKEYKCALREAGRQIMQNRCLHEELNILLKKPLLESKNYVEDYIRLCNTNL
jgi:multimeric flavodoxin WrbA